MRESEIERWRQRGRERRERGDGGQRVRGERWKRVENEGMERDVVRTKSRTTST